MCASCDHAVSAVTLSSGKELQRWHTETHSKPSWFARLHTDGGSCSSSKQHECLREACHSLSQQERAVV